MIEKTDGVHMGIGEGAFRSVRIGIDARWLSKPNPSGIGVYLIEILTRLNQIDDENEYFLFSNRPFVDSIEWRDNFHEVMMPGKVGSLWMLRELREQLPDYRLDVFWGPEHVLPGERKNLLPDGMKNLLPDGMKNLLPDGMRNLRPGGMKNQLSARKKGARVGGKRGAASDDLRGVRMVLTVHDIALMIHPTWGKWYNSLIQNTLARNSIRRADEIISVSKSTKRDLVKRLKVQPEKIRGIYEGRNELASYTAQQERELLETVGKPYLLYIGTLEPRKNVASIVRAFDLLKRDEAYSEYRLVLAGGLGWNYKEILKVIDESPNREDIIRPGYVSAEEKSILLHHARVFLFPSFYEGFGIPVVEAISAGAPVITARNSSLPEAAGPAESYVDRADDVAGIRDLIREVLGLSEEERAARSESSRKYIQRFDWGKCAEKVRMVLTRR